MKIHGLSVPDDIAERWYGAQKRSLAKYDANRENPLGVFSVPQLTSAVEAGRIINSRCGGLILDVGCGCYHRPSYMQCGRFIGVDPYFESHRNFPSAQSVAESLPFADSSFDGLTMMSVIDHFLDLDLALKEAYRVLKNRGLLYTWFMSKEEDDYHHCRTVSSAMLFAALSKATFRVVDTIAIKETAFEWNPTYLVESVRRS